MVGTCTRFLAMSVPNENPKSILLKEWWCAICIVSEICSLRELRKRAKFGQKKPKLCQSYCFLERQQESQQFSNTLSISITQLLSWPFVHSAQCHFFPLKTISAAQTQFELEDLNTNNFREIKVVQTRDEECVDFLMIPPAKNAWDFWAPLESSSLQAEDKWVKQTATNNVRHFQKQFSEIMMHLKECVHSSSHDILVLFPCFTMWCREIKFFLFEPVMLLPVASTFCSLVLPAPSSIRAAWLSPSAIILSTFRNRSSVWFLSSGEKWCNFMSFVNTPVAWEKQGFFAHTIGQLTFSLHRNSKFSKHPQKIWSGKHFWFAPILKPRNTLLPSKNCVYWSHAF